MTLTADVGAAVEELIDAFGTEVTVTKDPDGGVWVVIERVDLGERWSPSTTWLGFHIAVTYPYADVYPHFIDGACTLVENGGLPGAVTAGAQFPAREGACLQISRKSNRWDPQRDTATLKAIKVVEWLRSS